MEALKSLNNKIDSIYYDKLGDVLYISIKNTKKAEGIDVGNGVILRVDPNSKELVGITILNYKKIIKEYFKD